MLCLMFDCDTCGVLATGGVGWSRKEIAAAVSGETTCVLGHIEELLQKGVARMDDPAGTETGVASAIFSGRMLRDGKLRVIRAEAGKKGGNPILLNQNANQTASKPSSKTQPLHLQSSPTEPKTKTPPHPPRGELAFVLPDWVPKEAWEDWLEMRKKKRSSPTLRAQQLAVERLATLMASGNDPVQVLDQSTFRGWLGLFEVHESPLSGGMGRNLPGKETRYESRNERIAREALALVDDETPDANG